MLLERRARDLAEAADAAARRARPRPRGVGHARRARRPDRGSGPGRRRRAQSPLVALTPLSALAPSASRVLERLTPPPPPGRAAARASVEAARARAASRSPALSLLAPVACPPTTRGRGSSGAARSRTSTSSPSPARRGSRCRCCSPRRSRSLGDDGRAAAVARDRARRRHARDRDGLPARRPARRPVGGRRSRRLALLARRRVHPQRRPRQLRGHARRASACGRSSATSTGAAPTPSCSASRPRCCGPRCGRSSRSTASWLLVDDRAGALLVVVAAAPCGWRCGSLPEYWGSGDWLRAGHRARQPNPDSRRVRRLPFLEVFVPLARSCSRPPVCSAARSRSWSRRVRRVACALVLPPRSAPC